MSLITKDTFGVCAFAYAGGNRYYNQRIELGLIKFVDFYLLSLAYMSLSKYYVKKIAAKTKFEIRK